MSDAPGAPDEAAPLADRDCAPIARDAGRLAAADVARIARGTPDWTISGDTRTLSRRFALPGGFEPALAFVERIVAVVRAQDHHPEIRFGWDFVEVIYATHTVDGLTENDFICAARIDALDRG